MSGRVIASSETYAGPSVSVMSAMSCGGVAGPVPVVSGPPTVMFSSPVGPRTHTTSPVICRGRPPTTTFAPPADVEESPVCGPAAVPDVDEEQLAADAATTAAAATMPIRRTCRRRNTGVSASGRNTDDPLQVGQRVLEVSEQPLQVRNAAAASDEAEVEVVGGVGDRDVQGLSVQRNRQRIVAVESGSVPVHRFTRAGDVGDDDIEGRRRR